MGALLAIVAVVLLMMIGVPVVFSFAAMTLVGVVTLTGVRLVVH